MNTEGVLRAAPLQLAHKNHLAVNLLHRHVVVLDALEVLLHLVQLVVVGGKERTGLRLGVLVQILHDGPCNRDAVVGAGAAP